MDCLDEEYAEFLLSKIWKVVIDFRISSESALGVINFAFADLKMAHTAAYYFFYRLRNKNILISIDISQENELSIILDCKDFKKKIVCKTKHYAHFDLVNHINSGKVPYGTRILIGFHIPKSQIETDTVPITITDSTLSNELLACISGQLYTSGNAGLELHLEELPPL